MESDPENNGGLGQQFNHSYDGLRGREDSSSSTIQIPQIELPKGGGALKSIDEKFEDEVIKIKLIEISFA